MVIVRCLRALFYPAGVWLIVLVTVFVTEYAVMLALPSVLPEETSRFAEAVVDAVSLTLILAPVLWGTVVRPLREVIRLRSQFLTDLFARIEAERRHMALELHDGVGQSLTLLVSRLRSGKDAPLDADAPRRWHELQALAQAALKEVKGLALGLRPSLLDDLGLPPALDRLVLDLQGHAPFQVTLAVDGLEDRRLPGDVETAAFRIVQEALANVMRHAQARQVRVTVTFANKTLTIEVADDGRGLDTSASGPGHLGLTSMRERARLLGGDLTLQSAPGQGTHISATIPVKE